MSSLGYQTVEQMETLVADITGGTSSQEKAKIRRFLGIAYDKAVARHRWPTLMTARESGVTAVAGDAFLYLPKDVGQLYFLSPSTLKHVAPHRDPATFFQHASTFSTTSGVITHWMDAGEFGRKAEIVTAETITVDPVSSSGENYQVMIHGRSSTDDDVFETVTITDSASAATTATFSEILAVSTDGDQTGSLVVKGTVSTTEYATLGENERTVRYKRIRFQFKPSSAETVTLYYKKRVQPLLDDDQIPEIPVSTALVHGAAALIFMRQRKFATAAQSETQSEEQALITAIGEEVIQSPHAEQAIPGMRHGRGRMGTDFVVVSNG